MHGGPNFDLMSDDQLVDLCFDVGLDSLPNTNQYGELNNRDEVIAALVQSHDDAIGEQAMPASVIKRKQKISYMTDNEKRQYFKGKTKQELEQMERCHVVKPGTYVKHLTETFKQFLISEANAENRIQTYSGWKRACKRVNPDCHFEGDKDIAHAFVKDEDGKPSKGIGEWDGDHGVVYSHALKEGRKIERLARKVVPGVGRHQARERMKDQMFSAYLDKEATEARDSSGKLVHPDTETLARSARTSTRAAQRYNRIARGKHPFHKENVNEAKKLIVPTLKPRAKDLNAALVSKKGGKHFTEKGQYKRSVEKQKMRREQDE